MGDFHVLFKSSLFSGCGIVDREEGRRGGGEEKKDGNATASEMTPGPISR